MENTKLTRVRLLPDANGLILVVAVASYLIWAGGLSTKVVIGILVLYAVTVVTANRGPGRRLERK